MMQLEEEHEQMVIQRRRNGSPAINVTIPVIVHILHLPGESVNSGNNIPYSDVTTAIDNLNDEFDGTGISFCPAKRDQEGNILAEEGVVRVPVSASEFPNYNANGMVMGTESEAGLKQLGPQFSNFNYMNIWVVNTITTQNSNGQVLGFAYFPKTSASFLDGITIINSNNPDYPCFGVPGNKVLVHEIGHYLKLYHTFEGDDLNYDGVPETCPSSTLGFPHSDGIEDTHPHQRSPNNSCLQGANSCFMPFNLSEITNNHMDYSSESCRMEFTEDQSEAMGCAIVGFRPGLQNAMGCEPGCPNPFIVDFTFTPTIPVAPDENGQNSQPGHFTAQNTNNIYRWYIDGVSVGTESTISYLFPKAGFYTVCLRETNSAGCTIETCKEVLVYDQGLCYNPTLPNCELLLNGDFSQYYMLGGLNPFFINDTKKVCNWTNKGGQPFFLTSPPYMTEVGCVLSSNPNTIVPNEYHTAVLSTVTPVQLTEGNTYQIQLDYVAFRGGFCNGTWIKFFIGFSNDPFDYYERNAIHSVYPVDMISPFDIWENNFERLNFTFTFSESTGKHLCLWQEIGDGCGQLVIKNISIKECGFCEADPDFTYTEDGCGKYTFTGVNNGGGPDFMYWTVQGGPDIVNQESFTYTFPFLGTYTVCLNITCENGITSQKCKQITTNALYYPENSNEAIACEYCQNPTVATISALRCDKTSNVFEVENFTVQIPKGFKPCNHTLYIQGYNGTVNTNSFYFDRSNSLYDEISISLTFLADNPNLDMKGLIALCSPDGSNTHCIEFIIDEAQTCSSCNETNLVITATCDDSNPNDGIYEYSGSFDLLVGPGFVPCGSTSSVAGFETGTMTQSSGTFTIPFSVKTNNPSTFQGNVTLCFVDQFGIIHCYKVTIQVTEPCSPTDCFLENNFYVKCSDVGLGNATFHVGHTLYIPELFDKPFEPCNKPGLPAVESPLGTITNYSYRRGIGGWVTDFDLIVDCDDISPFDNIPITYNFCNGEEFFCFELILDTDCYCGTKLQGSGSELRSHQIKTTGSMLYHLYPNPASDEIKLKIGGSESDEHLYSISDLTGKTIKNGKLGTGLHTLDLNLFPSGLYFIRIEGNQANYTSKFSIIR
ncbi:MAG: T9SS type A sorting domain-containing protein [Saprospiraceae bacterium]|nr:T9SS type A sorting domain-containing protein [Saprospiraceae bacterium]